MQIVYTTTNVTITVHLLESCYFYHDHVTPVVGSVVSGVILLSTTVWLLILYRDKIRGAAKPLLAPDDE